MNVSFYVTNYACRQKALIKEFKEVYSEKRAHGLQSQVKCLSPLADYYYYQKGVEKSDWVCLLKVSMTGRIIFVNLLIGFCCRDVIACFALR